MILIITIIITIIIIIIIIIIITTTTTTIIPAALKFQVGVPQAGWCPPGRLVSPRQVGIPQAGDSTVLWVGRTPKPWLATFPVEGCKIGVRKALYPWLATFLREKKL